MAACSTVVFLKEVLWHDARNPDAANRIRERRAVTRETRKIHGTQAAIVIGLPRSAYAIIGDSIPRLSRGLLTRRRVHGRAIIAPYSEKQIHGCPRRLPPRVKYSLDIAKRTFISAVPQATCIHPFR